MTQPLTRSSRHDLRTPSMFAIGQGKIAYQSTHPGSQEARPSQEAFATGEFAKSIAGGDMYNPSPGYLTPHTSLGTPRSTTKPSQYKPREHPTTSQALSPPPPMTPSWEFHRFPLFQLVAQSARVRQKLITKWQRLLPFALVLDSHKHKTFQRGGEKGEGYSKGSPGDQERNTDAPINIFHQSIFREYQKFPYRSTPSFQSIYLFSYQIYVTQYIRKLQKLIFQKKLAPIFKQRTYEHSAKNFKMQIKEFIILDLITTKHTANEQQTNSNCF